MISVVISAYNEEKNIEECIESVSDIASEVIVVDNSSSDKTSELAKKAGATVFTQVNDVRRIDIQKNYGFEKAHEEWILSLDADERVTPRLAAEIMKEISQNSKITGYWIPRKNIIFGKWIRHSIWWPDYQLRLFKKGKGKFPNATVHVPIDVKGETRHLSEPMQHKSYDSIQLFVNRMNNIYTEVEAEGIIKNGEKLKWIDAIELPVSDFFKTYFLQKGYRDGIHGLILSVLQAFYMFLVFAKVWEKQGFYERDEKEILGELSNEFNKKTDEGKFWMLTAMQHETRNPLKKIIYAVSKKLV